MTQPLAAMPARFRFENNFALLLAQLLAVVQGILGAIGGALVIQQALSLNPLLRELQRVGIVRSSTANLVADGVLVIVISVAVAIAGLLVSRPSRVARWFLIVWDVLAGIVALGLWADPSLTVSAFFRAPDALVISSSALRLDLMHPAIPLAMVLVSLYGLLLHPASREAFANQ